MNFSQFSAQYNDEGNHNNNEEAPHERHHQQSQPVTSGSRSHTGTTNERSGGVGGGGGGGVGVSFAAFVEDDTRRRKEFGQQKYEERRRLGGIAYDTSLYADVSCTTSTRKHRHHHGSSSGGGGKDGRRHSHRGDDRNVMRFRAEGSSSNKASTNGLDSVSFVAATTSQPGGHNNAHHAAPLTTTREGFLEDARPYGHINNHYHRHGGDSRNQHYQSSSSQVFSQFVVPSASDSSPEFTEASHLIGVLGRTNYDVTSTTPLYHHQRQHQQQYGDTSQGSKSRDPAEAFLAYSKGYVEQQESRKSSHHRYRHGKKPRVQQRGPPTVTAVVPDHTATTTTTNPEVDEPTPTTAEVGEYDNVALNQHLDGATLQTHSDPTDVVHSEEQAVVVSGGGEKEDTETIPSPVSNETQTTHMPDVNVVPVAARDDGVLSLLKSSGSAVAGSRVSHRDDTTHYNRGGKKRHHHHHGGSGGGTPRRQFNDPSPPTITNFSKFREASGEDAVDLYVASCEDAQLRHQLRSLNADISAQSTTTHNTTTTTSTHASTTRPPLSFASPTSQSMGHHQQLPDPWSHKAPLQFVLPARNGRTNQ